MLKVLDTTTETEETPATPTLDDVARAGARRMLMAALQVEVAQYVDAYQEARDARGRRLVVRHGQAEAREGHVWGGHSGGASAAGARQNGSMPRASASGSPAGSFRPTCAGPPRWPRCCRFSLSAGCPQATSAKRCPGCWETTRPG